MSRNALGAAPSLADVAAARMPWQKPQPKETASDSATSTVIVGVMRIVRAYLDSHAATASNAASLPPPPPWLGRIPLRMAIEVTRNGEVLDRFDADDGLWTLVPATPPPRVRTDGRPNSDAVEAHDRLVDAVQRGQRRAPVATTDGSAVAADVVAAALAREDPLSMEDKEAVWAAVVRRVRDGERVHAKGAVPPPPTVDYMRDTATAGKDTDRCTIDAEHESVSRVHARFVVGARLVKPPNGQGTTPSDVARDIAAAAAADTAEWGLFVEDLGSSNGTFVAGSVDGDREAAPSSGARKLSWKRLQARDPLRIPAGHGAVFVRLGGSSRILSPSWDPVVAPLSAAERAAGPAGKSATASAAAVPAPAPAAAPSAVHDVETGPSAFTAAQSLGGMSYDALLRRKEKIEDAIAGLEAARGKAEAPTGSDARFRALERDLTAVQLALDRARTASTRSGTGGRGRVVEVEGAE